MNPFSIPPILSSLLFLSWGIFIYFQNRKSSLHSAFLFVCLTTFWWQFSWFFLFNTSNESLAAVLVKIGHIGILLLPAAFLHFILAFLGKLDKSNKRILYFCYFITFLFEIVLFATDYIISGFYKYFWGFYPKAGFLHPLFLLFVTLIEIKFISLLLSSLKKEFKRSFRRSQIEYVLMGMFFYTFASSDFIVNYGYEFYPIGFLPILFFLAAIGYAIAKYHLMNVKVILTELLVGVIAVMLLVQFFTAQNYFDYSWKGALFLIFLLFGYLLIKSVLKEVGHREELERLNTKLKELDKTKSEFISIASHQLRTPLTAIKGYISMLIEGTYGNLFPKQTKPMENVYQSNERLIKLVNDLLNLSRLESGKIEFKPELGSLEKLIAGVVNELGINAKKKGLSLKIVKSNNPLPQIMFDPDKLRQVILNIVDNAIKYTDHGEITVKLGIENYLPAGKAGKSKIIVQDTGEGMTEDEIKGLFQMFFRATAGSKLHTEGAGIGLYIAKKFVEMHNGNIRAESKGKGRGSTFYIELPN